MKKLRDKESLRREAESERRAAEARKVLEGRIDYAMDRWAGEIESWGPFTDEDAGQMLGYRASRVLSQYGAVLV